jgi:cell division protease FtsH
LSPFYKNLALWLVISLMVILLFNMFNRPHESRSETTYSQFLAAVDKGDIAQVTMQGSRISGVHLDGKSFQTFMPQDPDLIRILRQKGVEIRAKPEEESPWYMSILVSWFPMLLLVGVWIFFMRQMQVGGGKAMSFGKSRARLLNENAKKVTFEDVAGIDEAKEELQEIVEFLKDPKKFTRLGGRIPKGVLLVGAPGTGKTLLARAIAGEAGVPFFSISGSDFVEMFVGVGASRVRDLFLQGKKQAPCIIFIDEIDAVGRHRGAGLGGGHDEREQTLNQLLVEMDGFESNEGVILISATNRPDVLDPALLRPGRFDRQVVVPVPDIRGREGILKVHLHQKPVAPNVNISQLARGTPGFTGADLENLVNEAALLAARKNKDFIEMADFESAKDKVIMGLERKSMILSEEEKRTTAYHEAGHALIARLLPGTDPVHKVTIIPRGRALGLTQQLPQDDRHTYSREFLLNTIAILMGGRVAEEIVFQQRTTGAANDIEKATQLARRMVCEWGMSENLGPLSFGKREEQIFLGREIAQHRDYSEQTAVNIDQEVRRIVEDNYERCKGMLTHNVELLHGLAQALLDKETLESRDIEEIISTIKPEILVNVPLTPSPSQPSASPQAPGQAPAPSEDVAGAGDPSVQEPASETETPSPTLRLSNADPPSSGRRYGENSRFPFKR